MRTSIPSAVLAAFLACSLAIQAQVPQLVNYQGRVAVGNPAVNFNGSGQFKFALVNAAGNTTYWSNDGSSVNGSQPTNAVALPVSKGLYSVLLGDTTIAGMPVAIPASVWTNPDVRLRVWFNDGINGTQLLAPDQRLAPNGYFPSESVSSTALAAGSVTSAKISNGAVGAAQLSAAVPLLAANQSFAGQNTFSNPANSFAGASFLVGSGSGLIADQGGSLELGNSAQAGSSPFIDFHYGTGSAQDFNVRLINDGDGLLSLMGNLKVSGALTGSRLTLNAGVIQSLGTPVTGTTDLGLYSQGSGNFIRFVTNNAPFNWYTDSGSGTLARMSLTPSGRLGIGTASPLERLHVAGGNIALDAGMTLRGLGRLQIQTGENLYLSPSSGDTLVGYGGGTGNLFVGGNLGLGTVAPAARLDVDGSMHLTAGNEILFADAGIIRSMDNNHAILFRRAENKLELREYGDLIFSPGATNGETAKVVMRSNGTMSVAGAISAPSATIPTLSGNVSVSGALSASSVTFPVLNGNVAVGGTLSAPSATIPTLNGNVTVGGEITANVVTVLGGSDVAEPYEVASAGDILPTPGMVVAIDSAHVGQMRIAARAYDKTVAGILSGANGIAPGITLRQKGTVADGSYPVASIGRVWCWCDADANGPIEAGDMLTTSDTAGHAMRVDDHTMANGAVIGKAMSGLKSGKGLVLVLVSLK